MSKMRWTRFGISLTFAAILALVASLPNLTATAQTVTTGEWSSSLSKDSSKINLNFGAETSVTKSDDNYQGHEFGQTYDFAELGLSREQVMKGGPVSFSLVREAGTIACEGTFRDGKGSGTFRFTRNPAFVGGMKSRGFDFEAASSWNKGHLSEDKVFTAAALNVTTALADDLLSAGFGKLRVEDLFKATIFKIDSTFMREMKATGYPNMDMEDLVQARIFKIDAEFVRQATQRGFNKEPFESLVKMRIFKVTPEFLAEVRNEGLTNLSVEESVKLRIFNIDAAFIRQAKAEGVPMNVERLVQRRLGVGHGRAI
ncbi:MAG TPA: hypothetical protein VGO56_11140 [Pyrinomonadaceae bacterium]|jgi:hypothetical protein|nr:hypothetical protein [Pyrinomonadaceae bacterium]